MHSSQYWSWTRQDETDEQSIDDVLEGIANADMEGGNFELPELESNCSSIDGDFEESIYSCIAI